MHCLVKSNIAFSTWYQEAWFFLFLKHTLLPSPWPLPLQPFLLPPLVSISSPNVASFLKLTDSNYFLWLSQMKPFYSNHVAGVLGTPLGFRYRFCNILGHLVTTCPHRPISSSAPIADFQSFAGPSYTYNIDVAGLTWFFDTGTTHHITRMRVLFSISRPITVTVGMLFTRHLFITSPTALSASTSQLWHSHLNHPFADVLSRLKFESLSSSSKSCCKPSALAKSHKLSFPSNKVVAPFPFYLVHFNIWMTSNESMYGFKYYVL